MNTTPPESWQDWFGNEIQVGDKVIYPRPCGWDGETEMIVGTVLELRWHRKFSGWSLDALNVQPLTNTEGEDASREPPSWEGDVFNVLKAVFV